MIAWIALIIAVIALVHSVWLENQPTGGSGRLASEEEIQRAEKI